MGSVGEVAYDIVSRDKTAEGLDSAGARAQKIGKIAGAAMTGIGIGMIALTDSAKKTNATIRQTALQLGTTTEEMRELTLATTNVTFPIEEVTASFDLLTRAGMTNKDEIAATATAYDTLGDAIGKTASEVTGPMVTAMKTFGLEMTEGANYTDKMTYLLRNTTLEMDNFSSIIAKIPPDIVEMGLTMDDTIALLGLMEESGLSGAVATLEFQKAVTGARKSGEPLNEVLGFTSEQLDEYKTKLEGATGMTQEYADAANTQYGTMDKLKHSVSELTLKYGSMLEPLDAMGPAMATLGPIMIVASTVNWAHAGSAWAMVAPYLAIIAPIIAVIAIGYILEKKFGLLTKAANLISDAVHGLVDWFKDKLAPGIEFVHAIVARFGDKLLFLLGPIGAAIWGLKKLHDVLKDNREEIETTSDSWDDLQAKLKDAGGEMDDTAMSVNEITDAMRILEPEIDEYERLLSDAENASDALARAQKKVKESAEDVDTLTASYEDLKRAVESLEDLNENQEDQARAIEHAEFRLIDAQEAYNETIEEYGKDSTEAARANLDLRDAIDALDDAQKRQKDIIKEIATADTEKERILTENSVNNLTEFETLLETKKTEFETALADEVTARKAHETIMNDIAEREADTQIGEWLRTKKEMESNPIHRQIITEHITKETEDLTAEFGGSFQHGGIVPGPIGAPVPIIAHGGEEFLGGGGRTSRPPIEVKVETTIYNYSDVEEMQRMVAEAVQMGIDDAYGTA